MELLDRFRGSIFGCAVGDALGTTLEFQSAPKDKLTEIKGGGPFSLLPGQFTDDTSTLLCLATSLLECKGFDGIDQLNRYSQWYREGLFSSNGQCFDIGIATRMSLERFEKDPTDPKPGDNSTVEDAKKRAGNGSLMRLAPATLFYYGGNVDQIAKSIEMSGESSRTTHGSPVCVDACRYFSSLLIGVLEGIPKERLLSRLFVPNQLNENYWEEFPLSQEIRTIAEGSFKIKSKEELSNTGYVVSSLETVLWTLQNTDSFESGLIEIVNLGGDADTNGAIYGQLAGAIYGFDGIPDRWSSLIFFSPLFENISKELFEHHLRGDEYSPSDSYLETMKCYKNLWMGYKGILRKLLPGVHAYKSLSDFETDREKFKTDYRNSESRSIQGDSLLDSFEKQMEEDYKVLKLKMDRKTMVNPFGGGFPGLKKKTSE